MQILNFGTVATVHTGGVAYLAHIGGFLFGVATARFLSGRWPDHRFIRSERISRLQS